jgi:type IV secretion system protein VirD4
MLGDTLAETMLTQSAFKSFAGVNTYKQAKEISDMIGDFTSKGYSFNPQGSAKGADLSESISEHSRPLFTPQDVLQLPKDEQIVLIQGMKPFKCKKLPYNHVDTWWYLLDNNPIEGGKLPLRRRLSISYKDVGS